jgi:hypothetical protein
VAKLADAADLGSCASPAENTTPEKSSASDDATEAEMPPSGTARGNAGAIDAVELALAESLEKATAACEWGLVAQLARELEARRLARAGANVIDLGAAGARARRERQR